MIKWARGGPVLTRRVALVALIGVLVVAFVPAHGAAFLLINLGLLVVAAVDLLLAGRVRDLELTRSGDSNVRLGEEATLVLTVRNAGRRGARLQVRDAWPPTVRRGPAVIKIRVPADQQRRLVSSCRPIRRGDREPVLVAVRSIGPLGLAGRQRRCRVPGRLQVLPPFPSRRLLPEKLARLRDVEGRVALRGAGAGTEFESLRDYVPGDDPRVVDWRASARRGGPDRLTVRAYRPERDRRVILALDTGRTSAGRIGDLTRLDYVLDAVLLLASLATRAEDRVDLVAHDVRPRATLIGTGGRAVALPRLSTALSRLEPALLEADHQAMAATAMRLASRRALVVICTDLVPGAVDESLLPAVAGLATKHLVLVAALAEPAVAGPIQPAPAGSARTERVARLYERVADERSSAQRTALAARLRATGAEVLDAPPEHFASALCDRYLELKAASRL
jgi:uncharacterized protein (DUF58 family)